MLGAAAVAIQGQAGAASAYTSRVIGHRPDWYLPLADIAETETDDMPAAALIGPSGTYKNSPQLGVDAIAQDDPGGRSVGFSGANTLTPHVEVTSPLTGPNLTIDFIFQPDATSGKHVLITTLGGSVNGQFSVEVDVNGRPRAWSVEGGTARTITGAFGDVPQGEAVKITYQRQSSATEWSQRLYVNGLVKAEDATPRTWAAVPAGPVYVGTWWTGSAFLDPTDGLIAHIGGWNSVLTPAQIQDLVRPQGVAWAVPIDAGSVGSNSSKVISVKQGGWHGKEPLVASAGDGALGTTTESGPDITYFAGGTTGNNDTFPYSFTDASGNTSPTKAVTIDVVASQSEGLPTSIAEIESRSGRTVTKTVNVAGGAGFTSLQAALNAAVAGDVIAVKGAKYFETISLTGKQGTLSNPIQVWGWHPDGVTAPTITAEVQNMPTWTLSNSSLGIYSATVSGASGYAHGFLPENEGGWHLPRAETQANFERPASDDLYFGPHMWCSGSTVFIRTQTDRRQIVRLIPDGKLAQALPVQKNPNNWSGFRFTVQLGYTFTFNNCAHIHFNWLDWFGGRDVIHVFNGSTGLRFTNGKIWGSWTFYRQSNDGGSRATNCVLERMRFMKRLPPWMCRGDVKGTSAQQSVRIMPSFLAPEVWARNVNGMEIAHCVYEYPWDPLQVSGGGELFDIHFHHNLVIGSFEGGFIGTHVYNSELNHNIYLAYAGPGHGDGTGQPSGKGAQLYIHHNIIDCAHAMPALGRLDRNSAPFAYRSSRVREGHATPNAPFPYRQWNNTYIGQDGPESQGFNVGYLYGDSSARVPPQADRANELWNSICVCPQANQILGVSGAGDVVTEHPSVANGTPVEMMDGMIFAKVSGGAPIFESLTRLVGGTVRTDYSTLANYKNEVGGTHYSASQHSKYPQSPQRWNGNSFEEDPQLNGGTLANSVTFILDAQGRFQVPSNWSIYRPHNIKAQDQGVNIAGRWSSLSPPDGPNDRTGIETGRTRFYIGAVDPVDDPTGSAIGPQP